jgi:hypothetical protein
VLCSPHKQALLLKSEQGLKNHLTQFYRIQAPNVSVLGVSVSVYRNKECVFVGRPAPPTNTGVLRRVAAKRVPSAALRR